MAQQHHIKRKKLTVNAVTNDGLALQEKIRRIVDARVLPELGQAFDNLVGENDWLLIDKLDIQLDAITEDELEKGFSEALVKKIKLQVEHKRDQLVMGAIPDAQPAVLIREEERVIQAFLYFIEYGVLPWWFNVSSHAAFEEKAGENFGKIHQLTLTKSAGVYGRELINILQRDIARLRLAEQFSDKVFSAVLNFLLNIVHPSGGQTIGESQLAWERIAATHFPSSVGRKSIVKSRSILIRLVSALSSPPPEILLSRWMHETVSHLPAQTLEVAMTAISDHGSLQRHLFDIHSAPEEVTDVEMDTLLKKSATENSTAGLKTDKKEIAELTEGVMIKNAGLVIIAPFLPQLFQDCGLITENTINNKSRAVALLHYIVFGNLEYREYDTVLNKVLCSMEDFEHIELIDEITTEEKARIEELLLAIVQHWKTLKGTSPDGLREGFLQRTGKLSFKHENWFLKVEQHTIDILLSGLPWTIGFIKLPWMEAMLRTEWN